ncbi:MAG: ornithine cyclodeaminase family protein [Saprospiraceae bacterium]|nr:ornithine cyclodeaminase family protein [Saprospiraceae bacterium]
MIHFSATEIETALPLKKVIDALKEGLKAIHSGKYFVPQRIHIDHEGITLLIMPAFGPNYFCTKLVSVVEANQARDLPLIMGSLALNDKATGTPLAKMDAPMITALRTGAIGAIGLDLIADIHTSKIGIIGTGMQGYWQTRFAYEVRPVKEVYCYSTSAKSAQKYIDKVKKALPEVKVKVCDTPEEVVRSSECIYTCTNSTVPVFANDESIIAGKKFLSIGSFRPEMQELPDLVYQMSDGLIIDSEAAKKEVGDVIRSLEKEWIVPNELTMLDALIAGKSSLEKDKTYTFKSVGLAAFDLAFASAIYDHAKYFVPDS